MLNAYLKHKSHIDWCEDAKTSMVFERLLHLPSQLVWRIIREACCSVVDPAYFEAGKILNFEFWSKYDVRNLQGIKTIDHASYVEDDVVMLAIGGNTDLTTFHLADFGLRDVPVYKSTWIRLLQTIYEVSREIQDDDNIARVFADLKDAFSCFRDYYIQTWLADIKMVGINRESSDKVNEVWKIRHIRNF